MSSLRSRVQRRPRQVPGEAGVWVFIFGDLLMFATLFGVFVHAWGAAPHIFRTSQAQLSQTYGVINTLLLTSSLFVVRATRTRTSTAPRWLILAIACGVGFACMKVLEYQHKLAAGIDPSTNDFWMYYFVLTGLHAVHVLVGLAVLGWMLWLARRPVAGERDRIQFESGASYWHMVDLLWIVLFPLLYLLQ